MDDNASTQPTAPPPTLLLVDGHYYAYRSFFAIRGLTNSRGEPTNAIFGFVKALRRMLTDIRPNYAAIIWDEGLPERRMALRPEYKQQRDETPPDLVPQIDTIRQLAPLLGVTCLGLPGHEADDLMASYAAAATQAGVFTVLATNDKDLYQLASDSVAIYSTSKADTGNDGGFTLLGPSEVTAKWGVEPRHILDVLALTGDSVDNIPGVPGVGPKTAAKLVLDHDGILSLLDNVHVISNPSLRDKISVYKQNILDNMEMVRLDLDLPLPVPIKQLGIQPRWQPLIDAVDNLEFRTLARDIRSEAAADGYTPLAYQSSLNTAAEAPVPLPSTSSGKLVQGELL